MRQITEKSSAFGNKSSIMNQSAFTLVELLVVIAIIIILAGIITPSIKRALQLAKKADAASYLKSVEGGALQYHTDNGVYPGQDMTDEIGDGGSVVTGSQMLAACLLNGLIINGGNVTKTTPTTTVEGNYISYKEGETTKDTVRKSDGTPVNRSYTLTDMWRTSDDTDVRAMLYYPSRIGNDGTISSAFEYTDNRVYLTESNPETQIGFNTAIWDKRFGASTGTSPIATDKAYNADTFILVSPSIDRKYFNKDDVMNFKK